MIHAEMRITLSHLCCPVPQEFSDRMQIQPGLHQFTGEGMAIAMPRIVFESSSRNSSEEPATGTLGVWKYEISIRFFWQSFEC
jgi:hypothetical protein